MTSKGETSVPRHPIFVVFATTVVQALATMALFAPATIAPELAARLDIDPALVGYQISITYIAAALSSLTAGGAVNHYGACRTSQLSLVLCGGGVLLFLIPSLTAVCIGSLIIGWGYGLNNPASAQLLLRVASEGRRNLIFSIKQTGVPFGVMAAGLLIPPAALAYGSHIAFLIVAALCFAWIIPLQPVREDWDDDRDPGYPLIARPLAGFNVIIDSPTLRVLSLAAFCYAGIQISLIAYTVTLLVEDLSYGLIAAGVVLSVMQVSGAVGRIIWGWLADKSGQSLAVLAGLGALMSACAITMGFMASSWSSIAIQGLLLVFGAAAIGWNGIYMAAVAQLAPSGTVGSATGGALAVTFTGVVVVPAIFAAAYGFVGSYTLTFAFASIASVLGTILTLVARRHARGNVNS